jgi:hypothetical protein
VKLHPFAVAAVAVALLSWDAAADDPQPTSGLPLLVTGAALTGVGVANLATAPICKVRSVIPETNTQNVCFDVSLIFGGALVAVGVPLLIVGIGERSRYKEWLARHTVVAGLSLAPIPGGGALGWSTSF